MSLTDYHEQFAAVYDTFYSERDVEADTQYTVDLLGLRDRPRGEAHVLDFGCGTGSHVLELARLGIEATGFDTSPAMIRLAGDKRAAPGSAAIRFETGAFAEFCGTLAPGSLDGAISIFYVLNCLDSAASMLAHLKLIRSKLAVGARFLMDVWNGAAVFANNPQSSVKHFPLNGQSQREVVRVTVPELDRLNQRCMLRYHVLSLDRGKGGNVVEFESVHVLRFLTPLQYRHLLELAGLTLLDEFSKGNPGEPITESDWYISYLARRDA